MMCCLFLLFYLPLIYDVHTPMSVGALQSWTSFDCASRPVRPSLLWTTPSLHCSMSHGDQLRTNQVHSRCDGRGVFATLSPHTPPPSIRKGRRKEICFSGHCHRPPGLFDLERRLPPPTRTGYVDENDIAGPVSAAPSAPSLAVMKSPERSGLPSCLDQGSVIQRLNCSSSWRSFFFFFFFFSFSTGLVRLYIAGLPLRSCCTIGAPSVQGSAQCAFFRFW